jgi:acyl carrier protein
VDSIGAVEMIACLEAKYGLKIPEEVLFDAGFSSIDGIAGLIARVLTGGAG